MERESEFLTTTEVADLLGLNAWQLDKWRSLSTPQRLVGPPWYKFGGSIRYKRADVAAWARTRHRVAGRNS